MALESYMCVRYVTLDGAYGWGVVTIQWLVAGSKFANRFLKRLLVLPLDWLQTRWPRLSIVMYVDDVKLKLIGTIRGIMATIPRATEQLIWWMEHVFNMVISRDDGDQRGTAVPCAHALSLRSFCCQNLPSLGYMRMTHQSDWA